MSRQVTAVSVDSAWQAELPAVHENQSRRTDALMGLMLMCTCLISVLLMVAVTVGNLGVLRVMSGSMHPNLQIGDLAIVRSEPTAELSSGQIVVLNEPGSGALYTHRVIEVSRQGDMTSVRTQGDANDVPDSWELKVTADEVPIVIGSLPFAAIPIISLGSNAVKLGLWILVFVLAATFLLPRRTKDRMRA